MTSFVYSVVLISCHNGIDSYIAAMIKCHIECVYHNLTERNVNGG